MSPKMRPMMWSSGTTGDQAHTEDFMASEVSRIIAEVEAVAGIGKVIAVVSGNAANMKKTGRLDEEKHPNVVFNGCSAHTMNLLLKDMFKIGYFCGRPEESRKVGNICTGTAPSTGPSPGQAPSDSKEEKDW
ncbi:hypothetical protein PI124_g20422 [Phytophthora idaei]|nr:hypothetical protein PI125_g21696 [Phytophthora idaei]KAG3234525.1 hypothetical protein PI124_g20422 [Phytophthora idaei]